MPVLAENWQKYPVTIPKVRPHHEDSGIDFDNLGIVPFSKDKKLEDYFLAGYNFSYWEPGQIDGILSFMSTEQVTAFYFLRETSVSGQQFEWFTDHIAIRWGDRYLVNLKNWVTRDWFPRDESDLELVVSKLKELQELTIALSPISFPLTLANILLAACPEEFYWCRKVDKRHNQILMNYHEAYPARLEWSRIGSMEFLENIDQVKAFLAALMEQPSLDKRNIVSIIEGKRYKMEAAHPGSIYIISTKIPNDLKFGPVYCNGIWPTGQVPRSSPLGKPFLDLLDSLGIKYDILWSFQILIRDFERKPFRDVGRFIWLLEETCKDKLWPLNLKQLHYTLTGHMLAVHEERDPLTYAITGLKTSEDYNPALAVAVKSSVLCKSWKASNLSKVPIAIREDGVSFSGLESSLPLGFKQESSGPMFVLNPIARDKPGDDKIRHEAEKCRDKFTVTLKKKTYLGIHRGYSGNQLGREVTEEIHLPPGPFIRQLPSTGKVLKVGDYLTDSFGCKTPEYKFKIRNKIGAGIEWLEAWQRQISS